MMHGMARTDGTTATCYCGKGYPTMNALADHMVEAWAEERKVTERTTITLDRIERQMVIDALETCTADWDNMMEQIAMRLIARLREGQ